MAVKRKLDSDDECELDDEPCPMQTVKTKAVNTGRQIDVASKTQMLLLFGQQLQSKQAKANRQQAQEQLAQQSVNCSQCSRTYSKADIKMCIHCAKYQCAGCTEQCYYCGNPFCTKCSIYDYSEYETRSVCFDCSN
ncbi:hypothetical protein GGF37_005194 [Kickxella alabastrina]|nr:hypothetical protein GGF37_005194 [Kickxella alabastrina]